MTRMVERAWRDLSPAQQEFIKVNAPDIYTVVRSCMQGNGIHPLARKAWQRLSPEQRLHLSIEIPDIYLCMEATGCTSEGHGAV